MTNNDFKKLLDEGIRPVIGRLDELGKGLDGVKKELKEVKEDQADLREILETRVLPPLTYIETTVKSYADRYVINEDHIRRLDKRLNTVEENLEIQPPQELIIPSID